MPTVPRYNRQAGIPASTYGAKGSLGAATLLGSATAGFGAAVAQGGEQILEARRASELTHVTLEATKELDELDHWTDQQTDHTVMVTGYQDQVKKLRDKYTISIADPAVRNLFHKDFERMAVRGLSRTKDLALKKEKDFNQGGLITSLDEYADLVARAETFGQVTERIGYARAAIAGAAAAGTIDQSKASELDIKFTEAAHKNFIKREILQNPDRVHADLAAGKYEGLDEDSKTDLLKYSQDMADAYRRHRIEDENRIRIMEERNQKLIRDNTMNELAEMALQGRLSMRHILDASRNRLIEASDMFTLRAVMEQREGGIDDPGTRLDVYDRILSGTATRNDILGRVGKGLSTKTAEGFLDKLKTIQEDDVSKQVWYKDSKTMIGEMLQTTGIMDKFDSDEKPRTQRALEEFDQRVRKGENFMDVREDVVNRYRPRLPSLGEFPKPLYGTKGNPAEAFKKTRAAYDRGEISQAVYFREVELLDALSTILEKEAPEPGKPAAKPAKATDTKKAVKERKNAW